MFFYSAGMIDPAQSHLGLEPPDQKHINTSWTHTYKHSHTSTYTHTHTLIHQFFYDNAVNS